MNQTISVPYNWLKTIDPELLKADSIPLLGNPPAFPWEQFTTELQKFFQVNDLELHHGEITWKSAQDVLEGFTSERHTLNIAFSSLNGHVSWILNSRDIAFLMSSVISQKAASSDELDVDKDFLEGFYNFAALEVLNVFTHLEFDKTLTPQLLDDHTEPNVNCLSVDIDIKLYGKTITGRLLIPPQFHDSWKENYSQRKLKTSLSQTLAEKINLTIHLEGGKTVLTPKDFKGLSVGDFILLDTHSIDPDGKDNKVTITINDIPLYRASIQNGSLKILESPPFQEVVAAMDKDFNDDEHTEGFDHHDDEDEELDHLEEQVGDHDEEHLDDDHHEEETEEEFSEEHHKTPAPAPKAAPALKTKTVAHEQNKAFSPEDIPVNLVIEAGRLAVSIKKLLDLQPGNILELDVKPENGVNLVVNGRIIGKGELLKIGDILGVRVLDLG